MSLRYHFPKQPLTLEELKVLIEKVKNRDGNFTNNEIMSFPLGTQVKIKASVQAGDRFRQVGALVFQPLYDLDEHDSSERLFGILVNGAVCFNFRSADFEIVSLQKIYVPPYEGGGYSEN